MNKTVLSVVSSAKIRRLLRTALCLILCAGIAVIVTMCWKDEDCKTCTNSSTGQSRTYCGDELKEAQALPNVTCK